MSATDLGMAVPIERLLLVEDSEIDRHRLTRVLSNMSPRLKITVAGSARQAIALLDTERFDVAMVDWRLPDGTGDRVLLRATQCEPPLPVVMMTGGDSTDAERMISKGAQDFVSKRASPDDIRRAVQYAVKRAQLRLVAEQQAQLRESRDRSAALSRLAAGIAHDLNNTLTVVSMNLELLTELVGPLSGEADECLVSAREAALAASRRCAQLRTYTGSVEVRSHPVDAVDLVRQVLHAQGLPLTPDIDGLHGPVAMVRGDVDLLRTVFDRLLQGTIDLGTPEAPIFDVEPTIDSHGVQWILPIEGHAPPDLRVRLSWTGSRANPTDIRRRFDPFGEGAQGASLQLGECLGFLRAHSGALSSQCDDSGGSFDVWLPRLHTQAARPHLPARPTVQGAPSVWVVDDEPMVRRVLVRLLESRGMDVESFSDGSEVYNAALEGRTCDLLVTDLLMPIMGGAELVAHLRADGWTQPVVVVTGYSDQVNTMSTTEGVRVLLKPFTNAEMFEVLESFGMVLR